MDVAGDLWHGAAFDASVAGLCPTVYRRLSVGVRMGRSAFVATISFSCTNHHALDLTDGQQQGTESLSCCDLRTNWRVQLSYALISHVINFILSALLSEFIIGSLPPGYYFPAPSIDQANPCSCNSIAYNLIAACSTCQNSTYIT